MDRVQMYCGLAEIGTVRNLGTALHLPADDEQRNLRVDRHLSQR
jgi:hypothetical protein